MTTPSAEIVRALRALADENESWEWQAPVGPGNASYANGFENGRRAVGADLRALLAAYPPAVVGDDEYGVSTTDDGSIKVYAPGEDMSDPAAGVRYPPAQPTQPGTTP